MKRFLLALVLAACAHERPAPNVTVPIVAAPPAPPADAIARAWPLEHAEFLLRVDVAGLRAQPLGQALERTVAALLHEAKVTPDRARCIEDALAASKEIAFGTAAEGWVAVVRYDATRLASPRACFDENIAVATPAPGVFVFGAAALTQRASARAGDALAPVALAPGQYARIAYRSRDTRASGSLALSDALLAVRGTADVPEHFARELAGLSAQAPTQIVEGLRLVKPPVDAKTVDRLSHALMMSGSGSHLMFAFTLAEPAADQASDVGVLGAMAIAGVRKYLLASKEAEARNAVGFIGKCLAEWWEREEPPPVPKHRKLVSFPPVPKDVPRAATYASTPGDWAAWAPLKFSMDEPQRYQYEVRAAKDGKSADVIARGDLDGDGKTSQFVLHVEVRHGSLVFAPALVETDPDE